MQQGAGVSDETAFMFWGTPVEFDRTDSIFMNPAGRLTEEYVTGRFR
jgi:phosphate transport system ATP-binding protein